MPSLYDVEGRVGQGLFLAGIASCVAKLVADIASCVGYGIWKAAGQVEHLCFGRPKIVRDEVEGPIWIEGTVVDCRSIRVVVSATLLDWVLALLADG
jgi:hypothetical protein